MGYLDTSVLVPLLAEEPSSRACSEFWFTVDGVVSSRLLYVEAASALARAERGGRLDRGRHDHGRAALDVYFAEIEIIEVDEPLVTFAANLAHRFGLRAYDAVHCAAAAQLDEPDLVAGSGDKRLLAAWRELGVATFDPAAPA